MNGLEVIRRARAQFGEATALTVQEITFREWVNSALLELYTDLPAAELRTLIDETDVALAGGEGTIPDTVDRIVSVKSAGDPILEVSPHIIRSTDAGSYFQPIQHIYARMERTIWVRPDDLPNVTLVHISPPDLLDTTDGTGDFEEGSPDIHTLTGILEHWHPGLVHLVTSFAYAQEEDLPQAESYYNRYQNLIGGGRGMEAALAAAQQQQPAAG